MEYARITNRHLRFDTLHTPTTVPRAAFLGALFPSARRLRFSLASFFACVASLRFLSLAACSRSRVALLPIRPGASLSPNAAATWPRCRRLTWKMCFSFAGNVAYARTCARNASRARVAKPASRATSACSRFCSRCAAGCRCGSRSYFRRAPAFSAFGFFSRAVRPTLARGLSLAEQTRALGEKWRLAEQSAKDAFAEEARRAKEAYLAEANEKARASERRSDPDPGPDPDLDPAAAPSPSREKKKRKAPPPPDPEAAEALLRERFEAEGGDVDAFSAFLKGKSVSSDALGAFLKKHEVPNVKRMKKEARVERAVAVLTRTHHPKASPSADAAS